MFIAKQTKKHTEQEKALYMLERTVQQKHSLISNHFNTDSNSIVSTNVLSYFAKHTLRTLSGKSLLPDETFGHLYVTNHRQMCLLAVSCSCQTSTLQSLAQSSQHVKKYENY